MLSLPSCLLLSHTHTHGNALQKIGISGYENVWGRFIILLARHRRNTSSSNTCWLAGEGWPPRLEPPGLGSPRLGCLLDWSLQTWGLPGLEISKPGASQTRGVSKPEVSQTGVSKPVGLSRSRVSQIGVSKPREVSKSVVYEPEKVSL